MNIKDIYVEIKFIWFIDTLSLVKFDLTKVKED